MPSKLIIAPHPDDEVLGAASLLNEDAYVLYIGIDEDYTSIDGVHRISMDAKLDEISKVAEMYGFGYEVLVINKVNRYELLGIKDIIEYHINQLKPDLVAVPCSKDFNQDHRTVYDACWIALRPHDKNHFVPQVIEQEYVHEFNWLGQIDVNYYVPLDMDKKAMAYQLYKSQVRPYRGIDLLVCHARLRGAAANVEYAEAFKILRWVDG